MTVHVHDSSTHVPAGRSQAPAAPGSGSTRPRWLLPGIVVGLLAVALVLTGAVSASTMLLAGLVGGMLLMHAGGHGGAGGHAGHGDSGGQAGHRGSATSDTADPGRPFPASTRAHTGTDAGPGQPSSNDVGQGEARGNAQHDTHACN